MAFVKLITVFIEIIIGSGFYIFPVLALFAPVALWRNYKSGAGQPDDNGESRRTSLVNSFVELLNNRRVVAGIAFVMALGLVFSVRVYAYCSMPTFTRRYVIPFQVLLLLPAAIGAPVFADLLLAPWRWLRKRRGKNGESVNS